MNGFFQTISMLNKIASRIGEIKSFLAVYDNPMKEVMVI